jgi:hypothetical protein
MVRDNSLFLTQTLTNTELGRNLARLATALCRAPNVDATSTKIANDTRARGQFASLIAHHIALQRPGPRYEIVQAAFAIRGISLPVSPGVDNLIARLMVQELAYALAPIKQVVERWWARGGDEAGGKELERRALPLLLLMLDAHAPGKGHTITLSRFFRVALGLWQRARHRRLCQRLPVRGPPRVFYKKAAPLVFIPALPVAVQL